MKLIRTAILAIVAVTLSSCGIVTIDRGTPPLTTAIAQRLAENYYNSCQDNLGQCADFLPDAPVLREFGWVRSVVVPRQELTPTEFTPSTSKFVLTAAGAKRCFAGFGGSTATDAGDDANLCDWLWAPARVSISRLMQHDNAASIIGTVSFSPDPTIARYLLANYHTEPGTVKESQGKLFDFKLTFGGVNGPAAWRLGDPESSAVGGFFIGAIIFIGFIIVAAGASGSKRKRKQENPFASASEPAPGYGFASEPKTMWVDKPWSGGSAPDDDWTKPKGWATASDVHLKGDSMIEVPNPMADNESK